MSDSFRIDSHKMALHPARSAAWLAGKDNWELARDIYPIYVEVGPVGYCNHQCTFCGVDYMVGREDRPVIGADRMKDLLSEMKDCGVLSVMFAGAGEPLLYKALPEVLQHADRIGLDTAITTNGVAMRPALAEAILGLTHLRWIKVSINAGDADAYARIHRSPPRDFERVLQNLAEAVHIRRRLGGDCTLGAQMVALPETETPDPGLPGHTVRVPGNLDSAPELARRLGEIGADYLVVKPYSQHLMSRDTRHYEGTQYGSSAEWLRSIESYRTPSFKVVVRHQTMAYLEAPDRGYQRCHATPFQWAYVEADGNVWGCSTYLGRTEGDVTFGDDRFRYGSIHEAGFRDIWRGERRKQNWEFVRNELDISECRVNCRMHQVNLYLEEVAHPGPHHSFI